MTSVSIEMDNSEHVNKMEDNENEEKQNNSANKTTSNPEKYEQTENISRFREVLPQVRFLQVFFFQFLKSCELNLNWKYLSFKNFLELQIC